MISAKSMDSWRLRLGIYSINCFAPYLGLQGKVSHRSPPPKKKNVKTQLETLRFLAWRCTTKNSWHSVAWNSGLFGGWRQWISHKSSVRRISEASTVWLLSLGICNFQSHPKYKASPLTLGTGPPNCHPLVLGLKIRNFKIRSSDFICIALGKLTPGTPKMMFWKGNFLPTYCGDFGEF